VHVVATAGHVDHGKSTLVRALTGHDPDRLAEERRRGLSIELGYCWTDLPGVGDVAFVDVPGHERFIATTLAGLGPVPVALVVVAADDPWMPQAAEHLAALDALGVRHGVLVVTRSDLADPGPALARAQAEVGRTSLAGAPAVVVSGRTGAGLGELRTTLAGVLATVAAPDAGADVRLWVDRRFHVRGTGTVVTGTLVSGSVGPGDVLAVGGTTVRVRGVEALGRPRVRMGAVARVALDLGGRAPDVVARGTALLTPGAFHSTTVADVELSGPDAVPERPVLHVGTALVGVRARHLHGRAWRLTADRALPLRVGDRAVLRDPGSRALWGVRVLDPAPPELRRRGAARARGLSLAGHDGSIGGELARRGLVSRALLRRSGVPEGPLPPGTVVAGDHLVAAHLAAELARRLVRVVGEAEGRGEPGVAPSAAAHALDLPDPAVVEALVSAGLAPPLRTEGGRLTTGRAPSPDPATAEALAALVDHLSADAFAAPDAARLQELGLDDRALLGLHRAGRVLRLAPGIALLPGADALAADRLRDLPQPFTTGEARQTLGTSRRVALPLLAHLDATGRTIRLPDDRRRVRAGGGPPGAAAPAAPPDPVPDPSAPRTPSTPPVG
jgi:selenocysteine-specific elongation factor